MKHGELTKIVRNIIKEVSDTTGEPGQSTRRPNSTQPGDQHVYWFIIDEYYDETHEITMLFSQLQEVVNLMMNKDLRTLDKLVRNLKINIDAQQLLSHIVDEDPNFVSELTSKQSYSYRVSGEDATAFSLVSMSAADMLAYKLLS